MAQVRFTSNLQRFFPNLKELEVNVDTVSELFPVLEDQWQGLTAWLLEESGALRKHVTIYINGDQIIDRQTLSDSINKQSEIFIAQALSGG